MKQRLSFFVTVALVAPVFAASPFIEEASRSAWDRGCPDWPLEVDAGGPAVIKRNPEIRVEKNGGYLRVYAHMRVPALPGESPEALLASVNHMLLRPESYPEWVMPGINQSPQGDTYFVTVDKLDVRNVVPDRHFWLTGPYTFHLLWFKRTGISTIEAFHEVESVPKCPLFIATGEGGAALPRMRKVTYRMVPRPEIIKMMMAEVYVIPGPKSVDLRMRLVGEPSSLVYQLMPEALLRSQLDGRGRRIFSNFLELRKSAPVKVGPSVAPPVLVPSAKPLKKRSAGATKP